MGREPRRNRTPDRRALGRQEKPVSGPTGFWCLIPIVGWFIWLYKVQTAINTRWEQMGVSPI